MPDPYRRAAEALDREKQKPSRPTKKPVKDVGDPEPMQVVGKKYTDPQSLADEEYMRGAQQRINTYLAGGAERLSEELRTKRKAFGLRRR